MANHVEVGIEIIFHATEDTRKVFEPISDIFKIGKDEFVLEKVTGHHGNPILFFRVTLSKRRAEDFVRTLVSKISPSQLGEVIENIEMYFEDSSLFLRIGKGEIVSRMVSLKQNNAIKIRIKVPIYKKDEIVRTYTELLRP